MNWIFKVLKLIRFNLNPVNLNMIINYSDPNWNEGTEKREKYRKFQEISGTEQKERMRRQKQFTCNDLDKNQVVNVRS